AEHAIRGMADAIAGGVRLRALGGLHRQLEQRADAAAEAAVSGGVGAELVEREEQREARLGHLHAAELDAAGGLPFARRLPAIARCRRAAAAARVEQMPDERAPRARVYALDGDAKAPRPPGDDALGTAGPEGLDDGLGDLLRAVVGGERHR